MNDIKLIRQLPELQDHQEWACDGGCGDIKPKLHRHIYAESWDNSGVKTREMAENYYTCQCGHTLEVWDVDASDYVVLPDQAYHVRKNDLNFDLNTVKNAREVIDELQKEFAVLGGITATLTFKLSNGTQVELSHVALDEIEAELKADMILGAEQ